MSIWNNPTLAKFNVIPEIKLTLGEGETDSSKFIFDGVKVIIKNEMANPNGSFKDRSLAYQISYYLSKGYRKFTISSSGNAAIAAAAYISLFKEAEIDIFIGYKIIPEKSAKLYAFESDKVRIHQTNKPKSDSFKFAIENKVLNLRGSSDDLALTGFKTIAYEIVVDHPKVDCVFLPTSSGTSALALHYGFEELGKKVAIFVCQTASIHPIAKEFDKDFEKFPESLADAIVDRVALRKSRLIEALKKNGGGGFVISNDEISIAQRETGLLGYWIDSPNSALAFAGFSKALKKNMLDNFKQPLILVSGL